MKKAMVLVIAVAIVFTLSGCGKDKKSSKVEYVDEIHVENLIVEEIEVEEIKVEDIKAEHIYTEELSSEMIALKEFPKG